jgi:hypothetical protein
MEGLGLFATSDHRRLKRWRYAQMERKEHIKRRERKGSECVFRAFQKRENLLKKPSIGGMPAKERSAMLHRIPSRGAAYNRPSIAARD